MSYLSLIVLILMKKNLIIWAGGGGDQFVVKLLQNSLKLSSKVLTDAGRFLLGVKENPENHI